MVTVRVQQQISFSDSVGSEQELAAALQEVNLDADVGVVDPGVRGFITDLEVARTVVVFLSEFPWEEALKSLGTAVTIVDAARYLEAGRRYLTNRVRERVERVNKMDDRTKEVIPALIPRNATREETEDLLRRTSYRIEFRAPNDQLIATVEMTETMEEAVIKRPDDPQQNPTEMR